MANSNLINYNNLISSVGKMAVHTLFPKDFEYYALSLELTTSDDRTIDFFTFPVMPKSITKNENTRINVKKTVSATSILNSKSFNPSEIVIKGNFGRNFKLLINQSLSPFRAIHYSMMSGKWTANDLDSAITVGSFQQFTPFVKTGYGCLKILQAIIDKSRGEDEFGKNFKLYLYNPTLGENYLVVPTNNPLIISQTENMNMIWEYTLNLTIVAPVNFTRLKFLKNSLMNILNVGNIQKIVNKSVSSVANALSI